MVGGIDGSEGSAVSQLAVYHQHSLQEASGCKGVDAGSLLGEVKNYSGSGTPYFPEGLPRLRRVFFPELKHGSALPFDAFDQAVDFEHATAHQHDSVADRLWERHIWPNYIRSDQIRYFRFIGCYATVTVRNFK